jgi:esterase/lipase
MLGVRDHRKENMMKKISILFVTIMLFGACYTNGMAQDNFILDVEYYQPSGESKNVAIMFLGGSAGGIPKSDVEPFTTKGYPCLKVGYFGTEHTPDHLEMIPLEYFEDAIKTFESYPEVKDKKIVVYGISKGGELALLLASRYKQIAGVIAKVPSSVIFQGIGGNSSSWSYKEEPIPFVPYAPYDYSKITNSEYSIVYELSLKQTQAVEKATIQVENISGPILILTGKEDIMWPSSQMGEMIIKRLEENKFSYWYKHFAYENAGHSLTDNDTYLLGGTKDGNKKARIDSEKRIFTFLRRLSEK